MYSQYITYRTLFAIITGHNIQFAHIPIRTKAVSKRIFNDTKTICHIYSLKPVTTFEEKLLVTDSIQQQSEQKSDTVPEPLKLRICDIPRPHKNVRVYETQGMLFRPHTNRTDRCTSLNSRNNHFITVRSAMRKHLISGSLN